MSKQALKILIVDDEPMISDMLGGMLSNLPGKDLGFKEWTTPDITKVTNGKAAIDDHESKPPPDLTFLDIEMDDMDGLETLKKIREVNKAAFVVMVSGAGTADNVKAALASGASGFIVKPYNPEKIIGAIKNYFKKTNKLATKKAAEE